MKQITIQPWSLLGVKQLSCFRFLPAGHAHWAVTKAPRFCAQHGADPGECPARHMLRQMKSSQ